MARIDGARMSVLGQFHPRDSPLHRVPAGAKLVGLLVTAFAAFAVHSLLAVGIGGAAVIGLYVVGRIPVKVAWAQVRPIVLIMVTVFLMQWLLIGWYDAAVNCVRLVLLVALAALVTLTTRTTEMVATIERALRPLGRISLRGTRVDAARIGLLMALAIRSVPVLAEIATEIRAAQRARGIERSIRGFVLPFVIRTLRRTDSLGQALTARGMDDDGPSAIESAPGKG